MKKKYLLLTLLALTATSCSTSLDVVYNSLFPSSSEQTTSELTTNEISNTSESIGEQTSVVTSSEGTSEITTSENTTEQTTTQVITSEQTTVTPNMQNIIINNSILKNNFYYNINNFDTVEVDGYNFIIYRSAKVGTSYDYFAKLCAEEGSNSYGYVLPGSFSNDTAIKNIDSIQITYKTSDSNTDSVVIRYGDDKKMENVKYLEGENGFYNTETVDLEGADFFSIETNANSILLSDVTISYEDGLANSATYEGVDSLGGYRINPVVFEGTLEDGVSTVSIPVSVTQNGSSYTVDEYKEYTYYSTEYVKANPTLADQAALTDPRDVAAYYIAFKEFPANYYLKDDYDIGYEIFGDDTRCVSEYNKTNGYSTKVPCKTDESDFVYYELDIALDSSYTSSLRGTGRVVVWPHGFNGNAYDDSPIAVYTNDHYGTFHEYLNTGYFGNAFNANFNLTPYVHGELITLQ